MYVIDERDRVVEIDAAPAHSAGAPEPVVKADEFTVAVRYYAREGERPGAETRDEIALVTFNDCWAHYLGPPNDEALSGHPLYERGLKSYGIFEVKDSSWIRLIEKRNRVHDRHSPARYSALRHFIFTFHDSTFECVAEGVTGETVSEKDAEVLWASILNQRP